MLSDIESSNSMHHVMFNIAEPLPSDIPFGALVYGGVFTGQTLFQYTTNLNALVHEFAQLGDIASEVHVERVLSSSSPLDNIRYTCRAYVVPIDFETPSFSS